MTDQGQGVEGIGLFLAAFVDERGADTALKSIEQAKDRGEFYFDEGAVVSRSELGKVGWKDTGEMGLGKGAAVGAFIGGIIALLAGPPGIVIAAGAGAVVGGVAVAHDAGFDQASIREIGGALPPGTSALVVITSQEVAEEVHREADRQELLTLAKDIAAQVRGHLEANQDVLLAMIVTEASITATEVVSSANELAVFGIDAGTTGDTESAAGQEDTEDKAE